MASIETNGKGKRRLLRPDMTAMVDVAFLLLMFFVLTAAVVQNKSMNLYMPGDGGTAVNCKKVLTVYLGDNDKLFLLNPCSEKPVETTWSPSGLRKALVTADSTVNDLMVVLKPGDACRYQNVVDALDEFSITGLKKYTMAPVTDEDIKFLTENQIQIN